MSDATADVLDAAADRLTSKWTTRHCALRLWRKCVRFFACAGTWTISVPELLNCFATASTSFPRPGSRFSNSWRPHSFRTALHELPPAVNADRDSRTGLMAEEEDTAP